MKRVISFLFLLLMIISNLTAQYQRLFDFTESTGTRPVGVPVFDGTYMYGANTAFPATIFKVKPDGTGFETIVTIEQLNGNQAEGRLILKDEWLFGITQRGGDNDRGILFKVKKDGSAYLTLIHFGDSIIGSYPTGGILLEDNMIYGCTTTGGIHGFGIIYGVELNGTGFTKLHDFDTTTKYIGAKPPLTSDGIWLYGAITTNGGAYIPGLLFRMKKDGTEYSILHSFEKVQSSPPGEGSEPSGQLLSISSTLYGVTKSGGKDTYGTLYKLNKDGSGYSICFSFNKYDGWNPYGSLIYNNSWIYGITFAGGAGLNGGPGVLYKYAPGSSAHEVVYEFDSTGVPVGGLLAAGSSIYGFTREGGKYKGGTFYKFDGLVGLQEEEIRTEASVYPNPNGGIFNVDLKNGQRNASISILNSVGKFIYQNQLLQTNQIDLSEFPEGIYFLRIKMGDGVFESRKIIIR